MQIVSFEFAILVFLTMIVHQIIPKGKKYISILIASIIFYLSYGKNHILFLIVSTVITYFSARYMNREYMKFEEEAVRENWNRKEKISHIAEYKKRNKKSLVISLVSIFSYFFVCKFWNLYIGSLKDLESQGDTIINIIVPLGISYYTFSMMGYLLDVYWRKIKPEQSFLKFFTGVIYFPHILQGPFSRYKNLINQLEDQDRWISEKEIFYGMQLMLYGYFKKLVIADRLAIFTLHVFGNINQYYGIMIWIAMIFSVIQIYCDFSGYMDIVSGASQMLGIKLEQNFRRPFFSRSIAEFWRRWHITLGAWFKDYLLMPISASKFVLKISDSVRKKWGADAAKNIAVLIPLCIVWLATGLWHGNGYPYVIWGFYYATLIGGSTVCAPIINKLTQALGINTETREWHFVQSVRTFVIFGFGRIITVPGTIEGAKTAFVHMFSEFRFWEVLPKGAVFRCGITLEEFVILGCAILIVLWVSILQERGNTVRDIIASKNIVIRWGIYYIIFFAIIIFGAYGQGYSAAAFMYQLF